MSRLIRLIVLCLIAVLPAACSDAIVPTPASLATVPEPAPAIDSLAPPEPTAPVAPAPGAVMNDESTETTEMGGFVPLPEDECEAVRASVAQALQIEVELVYGPFYDYVDTLLAGSGCQIMAAGAGEEFPDLAMVADLLHNLFEEQGWQEDERYAADSPTDTATAFRWDNRLALLSAGWEPAPGVDCPPEQSVLTCDILPQQQLYVVVLNLAQFLVEIPPPSG